MVASLKILIQNKSEVLGTARRYIVTNHDFIHHSSMREKSRISKLGQAEERPQGLHMNNLAPNAAGLIEEGAVKNSTMCQTETTSSTPSYLYFSARMSCKIKAHDAQAFERYFQLKEERTQAELH